jgi:hypothetical protein
MRKSLAIAIFAGVLLLIIALIWSANYQVPESPAADLQDPKRSTITSTGLPKPETDTMDLVESPKQSPEPELKGWSRFEAKTAAQKYSGLSDESVSPHQQKKLYFEGLPRMKIHINGKDYDMLKTVFARSRIHNKNDVLSSNLGADDLKFLPQKIGPYVLTIDPSKEGVFAITGEASDRAFPVVIIDRINGEIGIVNGQISFYKTDGIEFDYFVSKFKLELVKTYQGSLKKLAAFLVPSEVDVQVLLKKLESNNNIDHHFPIEIGITSQVVSEN